MKDENLYFSYRDTSGELQHSRVSKEDAQVLLGALATHYCRVAVEIREINNIEKVNLFETK